MPQFSLKDCDTADTIAALATPPAKSALGIIKISGKKSFDILAKIFLPKNKKNIKKARTYTLHYGWIVDNLSLKPQEIIDEVLISLMRSPRSYTTEDVVEISSHGGVAVLDRILGLVLENGARLAKPGEFSYRALLNGRIDLIQAEAILGMVEAKVPEAVSFSSRQLRGESSKEFNRLKERVKGLFIQTESIINFPEDDIDFDREDFKVKIDGVLKKVMKLKKGLEEAKIISQGPRCVICGRANSGKSTLFNCLLRQERVIVSKVPGTTRDAVEETINIGGIPLKIYDTAGILEARDFVTKEALEKTKQIFNESDLVILLFDGSKKLGKDDKFFLEKTKSKNTILVVNKSDLRQKLKLDKKTKSGHSFIKISAKKDKGLDKFEKLVRDTVYKKGIDKKDLIFLNRYQEKELSRLAEGLSQTKKYLAGGYTFDFLNFSLKECLDSIGKISGEVYSQEILEGIFSNFCIGK